MKEQIIEAIYQETRKHLSLLAQDVYGSSENSHIIPPPTNKVSIRRSDNPYTKTYNTPPYTKE